MPNLKTAAERENLMLYACKGVLNRASQTARRSGLVVQQPEIYAEKLGVYVIQAVCSDKFADLLADEVHKHPSLRSLGCGDKEGYYDWASETYFKPYGWIRVTA